MGRAEKDCTQIYGRQIDVFNYFLNIMVELRNNSKKTFYLADRMITGFKRESQRDNEEVFVEEARGRRDILYLLIGNG